MYGLLQLRHTDLSQTLVAYKLVLAILTFNHLLFLVHLCPHKTSTSHPLDLLCQTCSSIGHILNLVIHRRHAYVVERRGLRQGEPAMRQCEILGFTNLLQLCVAILATSDVKLDYKKVAEYVGPGNSTRHITR